MIKALLILAICFCTIYSPLELSRLILAYDNGWQSVFELTYIWTLYLVAILILRKVVYG